MKEMLKRWRVLAVLTVLLVCATVPIGAGCGFERLLPGAAQEFVQDHDRTALVSAYTTQGLAYGTTASLYEAGVIDDETFLETRKHLEVAWALLRTADSHLTAAERAPSEQAAQRLLREARAKRIEAEEKIQEAEEVRSEARATERRDE